MDYSDAKRAKSTSELNVVVRSLDDDSIRLVYTNVVDLHNFVGAGVGNIQNGKGFEAGVSQELSRWRRPPSWLFHRPQ